VAWRKQQLLAPQAAPRYQGAFPPLSSWEPTYSCTLLSEILFQDLPDKVQCVPPACGERGVPAAQPEELIAPSAQAAPAVAEANPPRVLAVWASAWVKWSEKVKTTTEEQKRVMLYSRVSSFRILLMH